MHTPFFTIIIPSYNSETQIGKCLESITNQRYTDYEVLIQDGSSTDNTLKIVHEVQHRFPLIKIVLHSEKDNGIYDAMNKAAVVASGLWIYFMGSDDWFYDQDVLDRIYTNLNKSPGIEMIYCNVIRIHSGKIYMGKFDFEKLLNYNICHQSIFLRKSAFLTYGPFDTSYPACADWHLNLKLFKHKIRMKYADITVAFYNENGFSNAFRDHLFFEVLKKERDLYYSKWPNRLASLTKRAVNKIKRLYHLNNEGSVAN